MCPSHPSLFAGHLQSRARRSHLRLGQWENTRNYQHINNPTTHLKSGKSAETKNCLLRIFLSLTARNLGEEMVHTFLCGGGGIKTKHTCCLPRAFPATQHICSCATNQNIDFVFLAEALGYYLVSQSNMHSCRCLQMVKWERMICF